MPSLPDYVVLDPAIECLPIDRLRALQSTRLRAMVQYVDEATPFWRRKLDAAGIDPATFRGLEDLARLPFCTRDELEADQREHPPYGSYLGSPPERLVRFMTTSGTTGRPLKRVYSARDWGFALDKLGRNPRSRPGDVSVMLGPIDGLMGPMASFESASRAGVLVVTAGLAGTRTKIALLQELRPKVVSGTASYLLHMIEVAREMKVDLAALGIATVLSVGEPGAAVPQTRRRLMEGWGAFVTDGYGMTELFPLGGGCRESTSLHIASDLVVTEIVDPETGQPMPPGERGEVVYTNIAGDTQPLLRYRTRDIARLAGDEPCACGFTGARLRDAIEGRVDDTVWFRGVNVFPSAIEAVIRGFNELGNEYEIVIDRARALPSLTIRAELKADGPGIGDRPDFQKTVRNALMSAIRVTPVVELLPFGTLDRVDANVKKRRVVDRPGM